MDLNTAVIPIVIPSLEPDARFLTLLEDLRSNNMSPIIVVNDGSGENYNFYYEEAERVFQATILKHDINLGKGRSLKDAFSYCLDNYPNLVGCVTADSDGQHTPQSIMECKEKLKCNPTSLILGVRDFSKEINNIPLKSKVGNQLTCKIFHHLYGINISDTQTGLRGIPAGFMRYLINIPGERFEFETQMLIETKHRDVSIIEMHIETIYDSKEHHSTHFNPIADSVRIYKLFGTKFYKFVLSSLSAGMIDVFLFTVFCFFLRNYSIGRNYIVIATVVARIISSIYNYLINFSVVFKSQKHHIDSAVGYFLLAIGQMFCSAILTTFLFNILPINFEFMVKVPVDIMLFFISYIIQKRFIY